MRRFGSCSLVAGLTLVLIAAASIDVHGQSFQGGVRGTVRDAGGVIPGVPLTLVNEQNNVSRETVSNEVGEYAFPAIDPAVYTIRASLSGYRAFERKGVSVGTQQFVSLDIILEVGTRPPATCWT